MGTGVTDDELVKYFMNNVGQNISHTRAVGGILMVSLERSSDTGRNMEIFHPVGNISFPFVLLSAAGVRQSLESRYGKTTRSPYLIELSNKGQWLEAMAFVRPGWGTAGRDVLQISSLTASSTYGYRLAMVSDSLRYSMFMSGLFETWKEERL